MEESINFLDYFSDLEDPRMEGKNLHPVPEILLLTLCAVICGAEGWSDVEDFGKLKQDFLQEYLPYSNGIPSDDTLRRFFRAIDPKAFQERFAIWANQIVSLPAGSVISIDGKASRHSFDNDKSALHTVSAFASEARIVLGQTSVDQKSNEITAIPKLLEWLDVKGVIITIDAMGCQHKIAKTICDKGGEYIFSLKGNQTSLHDDVKEFFEDEDLTEDFNVKFCEDFDKGHGRIEHRKCYVTDNIDWLKKDRKNWGTIETIIKIESVRIIKGVETKEDRYYISSLKPDPEKISKAIRSHWAIENSLHWVLDMSFGDDQSRIRKQNAPENMAVIRHLALNLIRNIKTKRQSIKGLRKMAGWDNQILKNIIQQNIS